MKYFRVSLVTLKSLNLLLRNRGKDEQKPRESMQQRLNEKNIFRNDIYNPF